MAPCVPIKVLSQHPKPWFAEPTIHHWALHDDAHYLSTSEQRPNHCYLRHTGQSPGSNKIGDQTEMNAATAQFLSQPEATIAVPNHSEDHLNAPDAGEGLNSHALATTEHEYADRTLTCTICRASFVFTADEQRFFREKQFTNDPKRCKPCRAILSKGTRKCLETQVTCTECGIATTVPFRPTQGKPVLCHSCFRKHQAGAQILPANEQEEIIRPGCNSW